MAKLPKGETKLTTAKKKAMKPKGRRGATPGGHLSHRGKPLPKPKGSDLAYFKASDRVEGDIAEIETFDRDVQSNLTDWLPPRSKVFVPNIHSSNLAEYTKCPRHFLYKNRLGLALKGEHVSALFIGTAFHQALAYLFLGFTEDKMQERMSEWFRSGMAAIKETVVDGRMANNQSWDEFFERCFLEFVKAMAIALVYWKTCPLEKDYEVVSVEERLLLDFSLTGFGPGHKALGPPIDSRLDIIVRNKVTGELWVVDHKTTSKQPKVLLKALEFDFQTQLYVAALAASYPNDTVGGILYGIAQKPGIKYCPDTKDKGGLPAFVNRIEEWYEINGLGVGDPNDGPIIAREITTDLRKVDPDLLHWLSVVGRAAVAVPIRDNFPKCMNKYVCTSWFGFAPCPYLRICAAEKTNNQLVKLTIGDSYHQIHRDYLDEGEPQ